ncbi:putative DNA binding domain-containing protein, partial [Patescibacteria group bacterium]|nr:putative DNA binding domain-containing protein [Patescibacteria group bacterium]
MNDNDLIKYIDHLRNLSSEREWIEFKINYKEPKKIGEYISALSNSACFYNAPEAYLIFGIDDDTHEVVGTNFNQKKIKGKGAEDLVPWLARSLKPNVEFDIKTVNHPKGRIVIFSIPPAQMGPVKFLDKGWIRIDTYNKPLSEFPEKEAIIWERRCSFEDRLAKENISETEILNLLDYKKYFKLTRQYCPDNSEEIIEIFLQQGFLIRKHGKVNISNLGAITLAKDLGKFDKLKSKSDRVV